MLPNITAAVYNQECLDGATSRRLKVKQQKREREGWRGGMQQWAKNAHRQHSKDNNVKSAGGYVGEFGIKTW